MASAILAALTAGLELLSRELADGFQHPEPRLAGGRLLLAQEAFVDQRADDVQRREAICRFETDDFDRLQAGAAGKHGEAGERGLVRVLKQVVAPCDGATQGLLTGGEVAGPPGEQGKLVTESVQDGLRAQDPDPGGGQLDGQRQAVKLDADLGDRRCVLIVHGEFGSDGHGSLDKEGHRLELGELLQVRKMPRIRQAERRDGILPFAVHPERTPARGEDRQVRGARQQVSDLRRGDGDLLEVVEHQEERAVAEVLGQPLDRGGARIDEAYGLSDGGQQELLACDWLQGDEVHAVREPVAGLGSDLEREPCLPRSSRPGQGDQSVRVHQYGHLVHLVLPAEEGGQLEGQVVGRGLERLRRREHRWQAVDHQLPQVLGSREILEPMLAEVREAHPGRQTAHREPLRGCRQQHLSAMPRCGHPSRAMDIETDVVVAAQHALAGMESHPNPDGGVRGPGLGGQRPLGGGHRADRAGRRWKDREEGVALGADLRSVP